MITRTQKYPIRWPKHRTLLLCLVLPLALVSGCGGDSDDTPKVRNVVVDETTGCQWTVTAFDTQNGPAIRAISSYIDKTMNDHEREIGGRMMKRLSKEGYDKMTILPIGLCDKHRDEKLHDEVLKIYDTFDQMQKSVGAD